MTLFPRQAPPVHYPVRRSPLMLKVLLALSCISGIGILLWAFWGAANSLGLVVSAACFWVAAFACLHHYWRTLFIGVLLWDGQSWALTGAISNGTPRTLLASPVILVDAQRFLCLQVMLPTRKSLWLFLEFSTQPERWLDLRRALYVRMKSDSQVLTKTSGPSSSN